MYQWFLSSNQPPISRCWVDALQCPWKTKTIMYSGVNWVDWCLREPPSSWAKCASPFRSTGRRTSFKKSICTDIGLIHYLIWQPNRARPSWLLLYLTNRSARRRFSNKRDGVHWEKTQRTRAIIRVSVYSALLHNFNVFILAAGVEAVLFPADWSTLAAVAETQTLALMN